MGSGKYQILLLYILYSNKHAEVLIWLKISVGSCLKVDQVYLQDEIFILKKEKEKAWRLRLVTFVVATNWLIMNKRMSVQPTLAGVAFTQILSKQGP